MVRLSLHIVANETLLKIMNNLYALGFDISTKAKFMPVAAFLTDKTALDIIQTMPDEQYEQLYDQMVSPTLQEQNFFLDTPGYSQEEWKESPQTPMPEEPKKGYFARIGMWHILAQSRSEELASLLKRLTDVGLDISRRENLHQVLTLLGQANGKYAYIAQFGLTMLPQVSDAEYASLVGGDISVLMRQPGQPPRDISKPPGAPGGPPTPSALPKSLPTKPQTPAIKPVKSAPPVVPSTSPSGFQRGVTPTMAPGAQVRKLVPPLPTRDNPMALTPGPSNQKALLTEFRDTYSDAVNRVTQNWPDVKVAFLGDDLGIKVLGKDKAKPGIQEQPTIPLVAGAFVRSYAKGMMGQAIGTAGGKLVVREFPAGDFKLWDVMLDEVRYSTVQPPKPEY